MDDSTRFRGRLRERCVATISGGASVRGVVKQLLRSRAVWQGMTFTGSNIAVSLLAIISTTLLTRSLTAEAYGSYAFAVSILAFAAMFFEFGVFVPAARLAAHASDGDRREIVGAALLAYLPIGAVFSATVFGLSFVVDGWFHVEAGAGLRAVALLAIGLPFSLIGQQLSQGVDRLHISSLAAVIAQLLLVCFLAAALGFTDRLGITSALVLRMTAILVAMIVLVVWLRPRFHRTRQWCGRLVHEARTYGFQVYIGRLLSIGTYNMDVLMLGIWANARSVGFYVLAGALAAVAGLPIQGMAAALFARMARAERLPSRWVIVSAVVGGAAALVAWGLAGPFIRLAFSDRYAAAAPLVLPLALAQAIRGTTGLYNTFLGAHARGRELRNAGLVLTVSNVILNFALIPSFGATGAAWASVFALVANLAAHVAFYRRSVAPLAPTEIPA